MWDLTPAATVNDQAVTTVWTSHDASTTSIVMSNSARPAKTFPKLEPDVPTSVTTSIAKIVEQRKKSNAQNVKTHAATHVQKRPNAPSAVRKIVSAPNVASAVRLHARIGALLV